jgi:hypothetical protein
LYSALNTIPENPLSIPTPFFSLLLRIVEHLAEFDICDRLIAGDWTNGAIGAIKSYLRMLIGWADRTAPATHSLNTTPLTFLGWLHGLGADDAGQDIRPKKLY